MSRREIRGGGEVTIDNRVLLRREYLVEEDSEWSSTNTSRRRGAVSRNRPLIQSCVIIFARPARPEGRQCIVLRRR